MFNDVQLRPTLPAADMARAKAWYAEKLGLQPVEEDEFAGAWYETGGVQFLLYPSGFAGTNKATAALMTVEDFDGATAHLRERGVSFHEFEFEDFKTVDGVITLPDGRRGVWFNDSEGNIINIISG